MSEDNLEGEQPEPCKEVQFVDKNEAALIQRVTSVMPIADELKSKGMLHGEKYDEIRAKEPNQDKMRKLFESLNSGDTVKIAFYELLEKHELPLFKDLGGICRKRKLADPESPVPCKRLNTGSNVQDNLNFNNASTSAQTPAPAYTTVYNIVNERPSSYNMENIRYSIVPKTEWKPVKPPAPKKEKNSPAPEKEKKPLVHKVKKPPAPKKEEKPPAPKVKKPSAPKKEEKPPVPKVKKPPAPKKENKPPVPKIKKPPVPKVKKPPAPKKNKPPVPKIKKPPVPKVKKPPAPKKNKPPVPKIKKPPVPKVKKPPAPKKVKKPAGRK